MDTHTFTLSGLGQAPFTLIGVDDNCKSPAPGVAPRPAGSCDHCATAIRFEFHLQSADGVNSKVGSDCIKKSGDRGLISLANREKNRRAREAAQSKRQTVREAEFARQRIQNGGLTDAEIRGNKIDLLNAERDVKIARAMAILLPVADALDDRQEWSFRSDIARSMRGGQPPRGRAVKIVCEIIAKTAGCKNSAAHTASLLATATTLEDAEAALS